MMFFSLPIFLGSNYSYLHCEETAVGNMNTFLSRLNALFAFSLTVAAAVTFATFLTTHFRDNTEFVDIDVNKVIV